MITRSTRRSTIVTMGSGFLAFAAGCCVSPDAGENWTLRQYVEVGHGELVRVEYDATGDYRIGSVDGPRDADEHYRLKPEQLARLRVAVDAASRRGFSGTHPRYDDQFQALFISTPRGEKAFFLILDPQSGIEMNKTLARLLDELFHIQTADFVAPP